MNGPVVVPLVLTVAALLVAAYLLGEAELDEILARWRAERDLRAGVDEWERVKHDLSTRSRTPR